MDEHGEMASCLDEVLQAFEAPSRRLTSEEWEAPLGGQTRTIRDRIERIEAELRAKDPNYRGLDYWIAGRGRVRRAETAA